MLKKRLHVLAAAQFAVVVLVLKLESFVVIIVVVDPSVPINQNLPLDSLLLDGHTPPYQALMTSM